MDVLVVSNCSGDKLYDNSPIGCEEIDTSNRKELLKQYPEFSAPAAKMYTGVEHPYVKSAVANLRELANVSWYIVSAGYGLLDETDEIVAYDCSLSNIETIQDRVERMGYDLRALTHDEARRVVAREKGIPSELRSALSSGYDLVFVVLSQPYMIAISEALEDLPDGVTTYAFASNGSKPYIGDSHWIPATEDIRAQLGTNWFQIRGELLCRLSERLNGSNTDRLMKELVSGDEQAAIRIISD